MLLLIPLLPSLLLKFTSKGIIVIFLSIINHGMPLIRTCNAIDARLSDEAKKDEAVKHALAVRAAVTSGNYVAFFRLYKEAPNLNTCLMGEHLRLTLFPMWLVVTFISRGITEMSFLISADLYVEKMRYKAVSCMCRSYRPTVPVSYISHVLGFSTSAVANGGSDEKDTEAFEECLEWLKAHGASIMTDNNKDILVDTKVYLFPLYLLSFRC